MKHAREAALALVQTCHKEKGTIMTNEVRVTSPTGGQKGSKPAQLGAIDPLALTELSLVAGYGTAKYAPFNYLKGYAWSLSYNALFRHLLAFLAGEERDPESGQLHTAHAAWHALCLVSFQVRDLGEDDRAPAAPSTPRGRAAPSRTSPKPPLADWEKELLEGLAD